MKFTILNKGVTLIELIVVIALIGILSTVLSPITEDYVSKAYQTKHDIDCRTLYDTAEKIHCDISSNSADAPANMQEGINAAKIDAIVVAEIPDWSTNPPEGLYLVYNSNGVIGAYKFKNNELKASRS